MIEVAIEANRKPGQVEEIRPNAVYDRTNASVVTGFSERSLIRAEEKGELIKRYKGRRRYYLGSDLLDWLRGDDQIDEAA
jgi:hypothetical protein